MATGRNAFGSHRKEQRTTIMDVSKAGSLCLQLSSCETRSTGRAQLETQDVVSTQFIVKFYHSEYCTNIVAGAANYLPINRHSFLFP